MTTELHTITIDDDIYQAIKKTAMELELFFYKESDVLRVMLGIDNDIYLSYLEAVDKLREFKIQTASEYTRLRINGQLPERLPLNPKIVYQNQGWRSWLHFLGSSKRFLPFEDARIKIAELIPDDFSPRTHPGWLKWCRTGKRPYGVPSNPDKVYRPEGGWKGWKHWMSAKE